MTSDLAQISRYLDGDTDATHVALIDRWLDGSPENALRFARMAMLDTELRDLVRVRRTASSASADTIRRSSSPLAIARSGRAGRIGRIGLRSLGIAAAMLVTGGAVAAYLVTIRGPAETRDLRTGEPVATLVDASDTVLINDEFANPGSDCKPGRYELGSGSAEFLLHSRVTMTLRGESRLMLHNPMHATVDHGVASFDVPGEAVGFTVDLPGGVRVVDLGTRFRVSADPSGMRTVTVIDGQVRIESSRPDQPVRVDTVAAGMTWLVGADADVSVATAIMPIDPVRITASHTETAFEEDFSAGNLVEADLFGPFVTPEELGSATVTGAHTWVTPTLGSEATGASITIDLGRDYELSALLLWNYNHAPDAAWVNGVDRLIVTTASAAEGVDGLGITNPETHLTRLARIATSDAAEPAQRFELPPVHARYVRLHLLSNHGGQRFGLSELRVLGRVPPSSAPDERPGAVNDTPDSREPARPSPPDPTRTSDQDADVSR